MKYLFLGIAGLFLIGLLLYGGQKFGGDTSFTNTNIATIASKISATPKEQYVLQVILKNGEFDLSRFDNTQDVIDNILSVERKMKVKDIDILKNDAGKNIINQAKIMK
jgi:hypothetical protein